MVKMVGPRCWILVIGLLVFLTPGGESRIGDSCCKEDWHDLVDPLLKAYKKHASDLKSPAFQEAMMAWVTDRDTENSFTELANLCGGHIGYKCDGNNASAECVCNEATGHFAEGKTCRVTEKMAVCPQDCMMNKNGVSSQFQSPIIIWVIITILAYIGRSVIGMEGRLSGTVAV